METKDSSSDKNILEPQGTHSKQYTFTNIIKFAEGDSNKLLDKYSKLQSVLNNNDQIINWKLKRKSLGNLLIASDSLENFPKEFLTLENFQNYIACHFIIHEKGSSQAHSYSYSKHGSSDFSSIDVNEFNSFFNVIKKSKNKSFNQTQIKGIEFNFLGTFLAKEFSLTKHNIILVVSRSDFLVPTREELSFFSSFSKMLTPIFNGLLRHESSNSKVIHLIHCLYEYCYPLALFSGQEILFKNTLFKKYETQDSLVLKEEYFLDEIHKIAIYESHGLEENTSDLFHFQRVSLLGELLNTLRHELSNPLFGLGLTSKIIENELTNKDDIELFHEISNNIQRCQLIIENFSNLYKNVDIKQPVLIKKIAEEALTLTKSETRGIDKRLILNDGTDHLSIEINQTWLVQIFFNLIVNAAQALRTSDVKNPQIDIVCRKDELLYVTVKDNGPGIPESKISNLFQAFFTTKEQGTGLGLAISRNLARKMKGDLIYNSNENSGAKFTLILPLGKNENTYH